MLLSLIAAAAIMTPSGLQTNPHPVATRRVDMCDLHARPHLYIGREITVRAAVFYGPHADGSIAPLSKCPNRLLGVPILARWPDQLGGAASAHFKQLMNRPQADVDCSGVLFVGRIERFHYDAMVLRYRYVFRVTAVEDIFLCPGWDRFYPPPLPRPHTSSGP